VNHVVIRYHSRESAVDLYQVLPIAESPFAASTLVIKLCRVGIRSDQAMTMLRSGFAGRAANDNFVPSREPSRRPRNGGFGAPNETRKIAGSETFRVAMRLILIASLSAFVLVAVSGAFLIGLALVGLLAAGVAAFDLIRRRMPRSAAPTLWRLDRRVIG
jgi:hypothetical protein